jgi:hypothetical protein
MYMFVLIALGVAGLWLFLERPLGSPAQALVRLGILSYAVFAIVSGLFWLCWPTGTGHLVPGHADGILIATTTQARGLVAIAFGLICLAERNPGPSAGARVLLAPMIYNLLMSSEALAAQFSALATPERWLYVAFHFLWVASFTIRLWGQPSGAKQLANDSRNEDASSKHLVLPSAKSTRLVLYVLSAAAAALGLVLFAIPYDIQTPSQSLVASSYLAHAAHGLGSATVALGALAFAAAAPAQQRPVAIGVAGVVLICSSLAVLALVRASTIGALQAAARVVAFSCIVCAITLCLTYRQSRQAGTPS